MKSSIRKVLQALGMYEACGEWVAHVNGWFRSIRITETPDRNYRVQKKGGGAIFINRRHRIYLPDMVVYFDFFFDAVIPDSNNEVHYETPGWHTPRGYDLPVFFTSFSESSFTLDLYHRLGEIKEGDVVFDIGAYCGLTSMDFARRVGETGHVYAFEADPENFDALAKNISQSLFRNVTGEHRAVWKASGELQFQADGTMGGGVAAVSTRTYSTVTVKSVNLNDYVAEKQIGRIDLIKLDVEGSEIEILNSSRQIFRSFKPRLIVELHRVQDIWTTEACRAILLSENYDVRIEPQPGTSFPLLIAFPK